MKISRADFAKIKAKHTKQAEAQVLGTDAQGTSVAGGAEAAEVTPTVANPISVRVPDDVVRAKGKKRRRDDKGKSPGGSFQQMPSSPPPPPPSKVCHGAEVFMSPQFAMHGKVDLDLTVPEQGVFNSEVSDGMLTALMEMQVRGFIITKRVNQFIHQRERREEGLKKSLEEAAATKADLEAKLAESALQLAKLAEVKSGLEKERKKSEELGTQVTDLKKQVVNLQKRNYDSEISLAEATAEVIQKNTVIAEQTKKIEYLEGGLIGEHEEGFARAVRQAKYFASKGFPFGKMSFDINRDVYQGVLMDDEDIPRETEDEAAQVPPDPIESAAAQPTPDPASTSQPEPEVNILD